MTAAALTWDPAADATPAEQAAMATLPAFLAPAEKLRLARIRAGRNLFSGRWRKHLITEGRTAHLFKALTNASGQERSLLVTVNVLGLAARKTADLLMLDPPGIKADDGLPAQQEAINRIGQASHIEPVLYEAALTGTYEGESWQQVMRLDNRVIIANVPADMCFGVGPLRADGSYDAVAKRWVVPVGDGQHRRWYLRTETHRPGTIDNALHELNQRGAIEGRRDLSLIYGAGATPPEQIDTGVDEPLLDFVPNFRVGGRCQSDFEGVDELVDQFTAAVSQVARVLALHADPKLGLPENLFDEDGNLKAAYAEVFPFVTKDESPFYMTWNAQLESGLKMIDNWLRWLLIVIEMSPSLIGLKEGAAPDAFKKLRLEAVNTLAKVARKKLYWDRHLRDRYRVAHKLENATGLLRYDFADVDVDWNDGIPIDEAERIDTIVSKRAAGILDRATAVEQAEGPEAAEQIVERLAEEDQQRNRITMQLGERNEIQTVLGGPGGEGI